MSTPAAMAYAITNNAGALYIGATTDLAKRLAAHNQKTGSRFTKEHGGYWRVVHTQPTAGMAEARCIEAWWTEHLNMKRPLPFLDFEPKAWPQHHDHIRRHARRGEPIFEKTDGFIWSHTPEPKIAPRSRMLQAREGGPFYHAASPNLREAKAVVEDLGFTIARKSTVHIGTLWVLIDANGKELPRLAKHTTAIGTCLIHDAVTYYERAKQNR